MTNRKSTTGFPTAIDGVRTFPLSPQKVAQKAIFCFFFVSSTSHIVCMLLLICFNVFDATNNNNVM